MKNRILLRAAIVVGCGFTALAGVAQTLDFSRVGETVADEKGELIFADTCATCHSSAQSGRTPSRFSLGQLTARAIVAALEDGVMRAEGANLTPAQRVIVAEHLTGTAYTSGGLPQAAYCAMRGFAPLDTGAISWMGFGGNLGGTGFQAGDRAGLAAADVPDLELRWAFAFPDATQVRTKPTVVGDVLLVGDQYGGVYAIEAASGCVRWTFAADSGIRGAILVADDADGRSLAYFVDFRTSVYALDLTDGSVVWKQRVGRHAESSNTGSPALHDGRLFVPISNMEVVTAMDPTYECCTASGAVAALDADTGELIWYHRVIAEAPVATGNSTAGTRQFAPSGAPVWSSPTVDIERGLVYVGTGENYTRPATRNSDSILAIDIETGKLAWSFQALADDAWTMACGTEYDQNCPAANGPDLDFGMAPILISREDDSEILVVGQKSGVVWALDPDAEGEVVWSTRVGKGGALGGVHWGMATDGRRVYAPVADRADAIIVDVNPDRPVSPGLYALDLMNGREIWRTPAPTDTCLGKKGCFAANSAAPTVIPGAIFTGGLDGYIRAYSTEDGSLLWEYDTTGVYETINGIPGHGGAIDGPAPVIAGGLVFVNSGYGLFGQMPGNVLLAFGVGDK
ncbi:MAG: PQQ-binding-like beta-propeller repeat protein [Gammaproteobacteria bacterium]|nr:PQQ-binding-like beta-propeller repeat protein [Gammaproteobacteria bacterium]